jgi:hypothetical protein
MLNGLAQTRMTMIIVVIHTTPSDPHIRRSLTHRHTMAVITRTCRLNLLG